MCRGPSFEQTCVPLTQGRVVAHLFETDQVVLTFEKKNQFAITSVSFGADPSR